MKVIQYRQTLGAVWISVQCTLFPPYLQNRKSNGRCVCPISGLCRTELGEDLIYLCLPLFVSLIRFVYCITVEAGYDCLDVSIRISYSYVFTVLLFCLPKSVIKKSYYGNIRVSLKIVVQTTNI